MGFHPWQVMVMMFIFLEMFLLLTNAARDAFFDENYNVTWGRDRILFFKNGREVQLSLDHLSGAGFASKAYFGSGLFQMRIKLPDKDSAGVVTAFYLNTNVGGHDEVDFEFLGNRPGKPIGLQTNVFADGVGGREERITLWFDPTADFHYYKILWNQRHIVFFVDDIPIRIHKNNKIKHGKPIQGNKLKGIGYPKRPMQVVVSLWDGSDWATDGGQSKANWAHEPFQAHFQDFNIDGCPSVPTVSNKDCYSSRYWWNRKKYRDLDQRQLRAYENVRKKYMDYDYCTDRRRYPIPHPECSG
ncbi:hypothetical protein OSB04_001026 [Centaurea solstitialis]|uniref:Xyloglucan endotransglucosylase/hydrolase n=1 Tax=Centaurea solstitialis TaxID=347529 RepID=A0AA38U1Z7_9ASTR|nr:hypothetical protein OSB04_001026 [Centaurea solstitialis]